MSELLSQNNNLIITCQKKEGIINVCGKQETCIGSKVIRKVAQIDIFSLMSFLQAYEESKETIVIWFS